MRKFILLIMLAVLVSGFVSAEEILFNLDTIDGKEVLYITTPKALANLGCDTFRVEATDAAFNNYEKLFGFSKNDLVFNFDVVGEQIKYKNGPFEKYTLRLSEGEGNNLLDVSYVVISGDCSVSSDILSEITGVPTQDSGAVGLKINNPVIKFFLKQADTSTPIFKFKGQDFGFDENNIQPDEKLSFYYSSLKKDMKVSTSKDSPADVCGNLIQFENSISVSLKDKKCSFIVGDESTTIVASDEVQPGNFRFEFSGGNKWVEIKYDDFKEIELSKGKLNFIGPSGQSLTGYEDNNFVTTEDSVFEEVSVSNPIKFTDLTGEIKIKGTFLKDEKISVMENDIEIDTKAYETNKQLKIKGTAEFSNLFSGKDFIISEEVPTGRAGYNFYYIPKTKKVCAITESHFGDLVDSNVFESAQEFNTKQAYDEIKLKCATFVEKTVSEVEAAKAKVAQETKDAKTSTEKSLSANEFCDYSEEIKYTVKSGDWLTTIVRDNCDKLIGHIKENKPLLKKVTGKEEGISESALLLDFVNKCVKDKNKIENVNSIDVGKEIVLPRGCEVKSKIEAKEKDEIKATIVGKQTDAKQPLTKKGVKSNAKFVHIGELCNEINRDKFACVEYSDTQQILVKCVGSGKTLAWENILYTEGMNCDKTKKEFCSCANGCVSDANKGAICNLGAGSVSKEEKVISSLKFVNSICYDTLGTTKCGGSDSNVLLACMHLCGYDSKNDKTCKDKPILSQYKTGNYWIPLGSQEIEGVLGDTVTSEEADLLDLLKQSMVTNGYCADEKKICVEENGKARCATSFAPDTNTYCDIANYPGPVCDKTENSVWKCENKVWVETHCKANERCTNGKCLSPTYKICQVDYGKITWKYIDKNSKKQSAVGKTLNCYDNKFGLVVPYKGDCSGYTVEVKIGKEEVMGTTVFYDTHIGFNLGESLYSISEPFRVYVNGVDGDEASNSCLKLRTDLGEKDDNYVVALRARLSVSDKEGNVLWSNDEDTMPEVKIATTK
ncbi:MAG: hypothetical protein PHT54_01940 [Candidatus Nanoarchaeia archaeon]|nr:hypothetical protein [Candidatus Nanoarchaeia archaeon]